MSINVAKLFLSLCLQNDLLFAFNLIQLTLATFQAFPILGPLLLSHPEFSSLEAKGINLRTRLQCLIRWDPFSAM